jgi:hypothetical protein
LALFGFLLSLPTLVGCVLSFLFWVSPLQSILLCAGAIAGTVGFVACLRVLIRRRPGKTLAVFGVLLNLVSCVDLALILFVFAADLCITNVQDC